MTPNFSVSITLNYVLKITQKREYNNINSHRQKKRNYCGNENYHCKS